MTVEERRSLQKIMTAMPQPLTEDQMEFASDTAHSTICFASPGTGKTHSTVTGIIQALTYHNVPGELMRVLSFTRAATQELRERYDKLDKAFMTYMHVKDRTRPFTHPTFSTLHSFMYEVIKGAAPDLKIVSELDIEEVVTYISKKLVERNLTDDMDYARSVYNNIQRMNNAFIYSKEHCEQDAGFMSLKISYEDFTYVRMRFFTYNYMQKKISQGDIPLYALYYLLTDDTLYAAWHHKYKVIIVDEFQDMTLLYLQLLSILTENLVAIGDMKQQIYTFNGASVLIRQEFMKLFPDAKQCTLNQSFRCCNEVAEEANKLLVGSMLRPDPFDGVGPGGSVSVEQYSTKVISQLAKDSANGKLRDTLFLFRLNASVVPVVQALYENDINFTCPSYKSVLSLPIFKDLTTFMEAGLNPTNPLIVDKAIKLLPEFSRASSSMLTKPALEIQKRGLSLFTLPEGLFHAPSSIDMIQGIKDAVEANKKGASAAISLNYILRPWDMHYLKGNSWRQPMPKEYYVTLASSVLARYTYDQVKVVEDEKLKIIDKCKDSLRVVRCYTCHAAKGLEAERVYILDADDTIFPQQDKIAHKANAGFYFDALCDVQAERNLLYVAITRAKKELRIFYATKPTPLLDFDNSPYTNLYSKASDIDINFDDVSAFRKVIKI